MRRPFSSKRIFGPLVKSRYSNTYRGMSQIDFKFDQDITNQNVNRDKLERAVSNSVSAFYTINNTIYAPDSSNMFISVLIDVETVVVDNLVQVQDRVTASLTVLDQNIKLERVQHTCPQDVEQDIKNILDNQ